MEDAVQAVTLALTAPKAINNTVIICPDDVLSYKEWLELLAKELDRIPPLFSLPIPIVRFVINVRHRVIALYLQCVGGRAII